jgi:ubiquinone/menaquinone biosynthesis C-methylase UbiE
MTDPRCSAKPVSAWAGNEVAEAWRRGAEKRNQMLAPATEAMLELAGVHLGARVLDIGTGTGDTAIFASGRVGPAGHVVATDLSAAMIQAAGEAVRTAGVSNVSVRAMSADHLDVAPATFDAAIARLVLMFVDDLPATLRGILRALRPGGHFATIVWGSLERNPYHRILIESAREQGPLPEPAPEIVRAFSLCDSTAMQHALTAAGFAEAVVRAVPCTRAFGSAADALATAKESPVQAALMAALDDAARERAWVRVEAEYRSFEQDGACAFPAELLVAAGACVSGSAGA